MAISSAMSAFLMETDTHFEIIEQSLLNLDRQTGNMDLINELFRAVHSLKGNAGLVGLLDMHSLATEMETLLDSIRKTGKPVAGPQRDKMFELLDKLKLHFEKVKTFGAEENEEKPPEPEQKKEAAAVSAEPHPTSDHEKEHEHEHEHEHEEEKANEKTAKGKMTAEAHLKATGGKRSFLTFTLGSEEYGFPIISVKEIILKRHITRVPNSKTFVTGIMNLRGMVIPIIDARRKLGFAAQEGKTENVVIVEDEGVITGVLVDQVKDIVSLGEENIVTGEKALGAMKGEFIEGIGKAEKKTIMFLNIKTFCNSKERYY